MKGRIKYGERYSVLAWMPTKELVLAASERTEGIVSYFLACAHREDHGKWLNDLDTLARSCYLQGAKDTAEMAAQMRAKGLA